MASGMAVETGVPARIWSGNGRRIVGFILVFAAFVLLWEGYKVVGTALGGRIPVTGALMRPRPDNRTLPHLWDIVAALFRPARRGGEPLVLVLGSAALFTLREALFGFALGAVVGFWLGVGFVRSPLAERSLMPYVVASQTVPILAIAPMVVVWGRQISLPQWLAVGLIAAYLTFFPVTINTLRGLRSPDRNSIDLMRALAAPESAVLWKLRVPSALPYIFTALKVSATASVIGAIIGELPAGFRAGLGRALLEFSQQFTAVPEKLYAAVLVSALAGIAFVGAVAFAEYWLMRNREVRA